MDAGATGTADTVKAQAQPGRRSGRRTAGLVLAAAVLGMSATGLPTVLHRVGQ